MYWRRARSETEETDVRDEEARGVEVSTTWPAVAGEVMSDVSVLVEADDSMHCGQQCVCGDVRVECGGLAASLDNTMDSMEPGSCCSLGGRCSRVGESIQEIPGELHEEKHMTGRDALVPGVDSVGGGRGEEPRDGASVSLGVWALLVVSCAWRGEMITSLSAYGDEGGAPSGRTGEGTALLPLWATDGRDVSERLPCDGVRGEGATGTSSADLVGSSALWQDDSTGPVSGASLSLSEARFAGCVDEAAVTVGCVDVTVASVEHEAGACACGDWRSTLGCASWLRAAQDEAWAARVVIEVAAPAKLEWWRDPTWRPVTVTSLPSGRRRLGPLDAVRRRTHAVSEWTLAAHARFLQYWFRHTAARRCANHHL